MKVVNDVLGQFSKTGIKFSIDVRPLQHELKAIISNFEAMGAKLTEPTKVCSYNDKTTLEQDVFLDGVKFQIWWDEVATREDKVKKLQEELAALGVGCDRWVTEEEE